MYTFSSPTHSNYSSTSQPAKVIYSNPQSPYPLSNTDNQHPHQYSSTSTPNRAIVTRTSSLRDNRNNKANENPIDSSKDPINRSSNDLIITHLTNNDTGNSSIINHTPTTAITTNTHTNNDHSVSPLSLISTASHQPQNIPLARSKRFYSNDKLPISSPSTVSSSSSINPDSTPTNPHQRGSSLRLSGKTATLPSVIRVHHDFQVIKTVDSSPRDSLDHVNSNNQTPTSASSNIPSAYSNITHSSNVLTSSSSHTILSNSATIDSDNNSSNTGGTKGLKFNNRYKFGISTPLVADYRPSSIKPNSYSDHEDQNPNPSAFEPIISNGIMKPPIPRSPTRVRVKNKGAKHKLTATQATKTTSLNPSPSEIDSSPNDEVDEDGSDCETTAATIITRPAPGPSTRSSLRKNSNNSPTPNLSDRNSPSPTKCVSWNLATETKNIPRSRSWSQKDRKGSSKSSGYSNSNSHNDRQDKIQNYHSEFMQNIKDNLCDQLKQYNEWESKKITFQKYHKNVKKCLEEHQKLLDEFQQFLNVDITMNTT